MSLDSIEFIILGDPPNQGSMKAFPYKKRNGRMGVNMVHNKPKELNIFRKEVSKVLYKYHDDFYIDSDTIGYMIEATFYIEKHKYIKRIIPTTKGKKNPQAIINGKKGAAKLSSTVTGRRKKVLQDGTWTWEYPNK